MNGEDTIETTEVSVLGSAALRAESPFEMSRGICKGIDGSRDTWADWINCGVGFDFDLLSRFQDYDLSGKAVGSTLWFPGISRSRRGWV